MCMVGRMGLNVEIMGSGGLRSSPPVVLLSLLFFPFFFAPRLRTVIARRTAADGSRHSPISWFSPPARAQLSCSPVTAQIHHSGNPLETKRNVSVRGVRGERGFLPTPHIMHDNRQQQERKREKESCLFSAGHTHTHTHIHYPSFWGEKELICTHTSLSFCLFLVRLVSPP